MQHWVLLITLSASFSLTVHVKVSHPILVNGHNAICDKYFGNLGLKSPDTSTQSVLIDCKLAERLVRDICWFVRLVAAPFQVSLLHQTLPNVRTGVIVHRVFWNKIVEQADLVQAAFQASRLTSVVDL